jgi:hypothetical protein
VLLADMGLPQAGATTIFEDNEICIRMSETKASTPRMQYLDARYHWLREAVVHAKTIRLVHCSTTEMVADVLTKPLGSYEIKRFHGALSRALLPYLIRHSQVNMGELACLCTSRRPCHYYRMSSC